MIPKILHYCWFGRGPKPDDFSDYLDSWKRHCPDFRIIEWNEENFDVNINRYCREAYEMGSFAHVSDVCRVWALSEHGGIYLDTDVMLLRPVDPFLCLDSFTASEGMLLGTAVMGARKGTPWLKRFMEYYEKHHFISWWGHPNRKPNTKILTRRILPSLPIVDYPTILPNRFVPGPDNSSGEAVTFPETIAIHYFAASWRKKKSLTQKLRILRQGLRIRYRKA